MAQGGGTGGPTRLQRRLVFGTLGLLLASGLMGIEAWPLSAWRLFSEPRRAEQGGWVLRAVDAEGTATPIGLARLPLGYRFVGRSLEDLPAQPTGEGTELCQVLLGAVREVHPTATRLEVLRTRRRLAQADDAWSSVEVSTAVTLDCGIAAAP